MLIKISQYRFKFHKRHKRGFTLLEILVSAIILALLSTGVYSVLISSRYLIVRSKMRVQGLEYCRRFLEALRPYVRYDLWKKTAAQGNPLAAENTWYPLPNAFQPPSGSPYYGARFKVSNGVFGGADGFDYREVTVQIFWNEPGI